MANLLEVKGLTTRVSGFTILNNLDFSIEKAKRDLGYRPRVTFDDAIGEALAKANTPDAGLPTRSNIRFSALR